MSSNLKIMAWKFQNQNILEKLKLNVSRSLMYELNLCSKQFLEYSEKINLSFNLCPSYYLLVHI